MYLFNDNCHRSMTFIWVSAFLAFVILLYSISSAAKCFIKYSIFAIVSVFLASAPIPFMLFRPMDCRNGLIPAAGLRMCSWFFGLKWTIKGHENIVRDSGSVVLMNHQSTVDLFVLAELWPILGKCFVISKKEIFYIWPFGLGAWLWGTVFIERSNSIKAQETVNTTGKNIRDGKAHVLLFPEGTRNLGSKLLPFKKGAFHLAIASQCPIQPVMVSKYTFLGKNKFDKGSSVITILPKIPTEGLTKDDIPELINKTYRIMSDFAQISDGTKT